MNYARPKEQFVEFSGFANLEPRSGPYPWGHTYLSLAFVASGSPNWATTFNTLQQSIFATSSN